MATAHPIIHPYIDGEEGQFAAIISSYLRGSMLLPLDEAGIESIRVIAGLDPEDGTQRIELILDDADGDQTVIRLTGRTASLLSAMLSRTLVDVVPEELSRAADDVHDHGTTRRPGDH